MTLIRLRSISQEQLEFLFCSPVLDLADEFFVTGRRPRTQIWRGPRPDAYAAAILIGFGLISSFFGTVTFKTPSLYSAVALSALTAIGSVNARLNVPYSRSIR